MVNFTSNGEIRIVVIGAGRRAKVYCEFIGRQKRPVKIVGIAEAHEPRAKAFAKQYGVPEENVFLDWREIAAKGLNAFGAQVAMICLQDRDHYDCFMAFAPLNYHILCEKPMAPHLIECQKMLAASQASGLLFGICHVLRYSPGNLLLKKLLDENKVGNIVSVTHVEPVGHAHFAHSFVRGNWRNLEESSFSLLQKSCHDIDIIQYLMSSTSTEKHQTVPTAVSSFGSLTFFTKKNKPIEAGNAERCLSCSYEPNCVYSAKRIYIDSFEETGQLTGYASAISDIENMSLVKAAIQNTNYGQCVWESDNDVCDNQVVNIAYDTPYGQATVAFSMVSTSKAECIRKTTVYGSLGEMTMENNDEIRLFDFLTKTTTVYPIENPSNVKGSHGAGDLGLVTAFMNAVDGVMNGESVHDMQVKFLGCTPEQIFTSHELVFSAEKSRLEGKVVHLH
jgi:predicted dehydrogenase